MERAHRWALDKGVSEVELSVWDFNEGAIAFYENLGYKPTRHTLSISLHEAG
jgi:GNAT superfamily N-acetyltransferase